VLPPTNNQQPTTNDQLLLFVSSHRFSRADDVILEVKGLTKVFGSGEGAVRGGWIAIETSTLTTGAPPKTSGIT